MQERGQTKQLNENNSANGNGSQHGGANGSANGNALLSQLPEQPAVSATIATTVTIATMPTTEQFATAIESLLFVAGRPLGRGELRKLLDIDDAMLGESLRALENELEGQRRGIRLQLLGEQVQLVTAPENARYVAALLGLPMTAKLTTAAMETLSVIAYRQPVTRAQIEAVRGVNSDRALISLVQHGLVAEVGRAQTIGRPALFATTAEFLQQFGLTRLDQLPAIDLQAPPSLPSPDGQEQSAAGQPSRGEQ